jgi:diguanylate cyclase (GGDEF)-like protein
LTLRHLIEHESRSHADLTRAFSNDVWQTIGPIVQGSRGQTHEELLAGTGQQVIRDRVLRQMTGLSVVKIKIYNLDGLTIFSTDERQVGEDRSGNEGFRQARDGLVASAIIYRDKFDAFEGTLSNRNLIYSYVPVRPAAGLAPEAVFEVYSDVTSLLERQSQAQWQVAGVVLGLLAALYAFLHMVVRKADDIIAGQEVERAKREAQIRHMAHHDALTGLANRAHFGVRLHEALSRASRHGHSGALLFMDLDRFKNVNDSLGHGAGDLLLQTVAKRVRACLRDTDLLFRMGGDEFTVILPELTHPEDAAQLARRIILAVSAPVTLHEQNVTVGATIGIAVYPADSTEADSLVRNADAAMYKAKQAGRGTHAFYRSAQPETLDALKEPEHPHA